MDALPAEAFSDCFVARVDALRCAEPDIVAIDGKTSRRAHNKNNAQNPLRLVSAWASRQRLVLGQEACTAKSNEITGTPALLARLGLTRALVTIDAMDCQIKIARTIRDKGADYLLALKGNWPALSSEVADFLATAEDVDRYETVDGDHGRIEIRRHVVSHEVGWLAFGRQSSAEGLFPDLSPIALVESTTERGGQTSRERRYYLSSAPLPAKQLATAARAHWHVENRMHWIMDVVFHDDLMRLRTAHGPANMATVRHMCLNITRGLKDKASLKVRRKKFGWNDDYRYNALAAHHS